MRRLILTTMILVMFSSSVQALALEVGGELIVNFDGQIKEGLELELFLPPLGNSEVRYAFTLDRPLQDLLAGEDVTYFAKKLYIKHRFPGLHLTLGRQPVSWSFGSLLNPVDYTLGAETLDQENASKYTDALEAFIPLNWNSSLTLVSSFSAGFTTDLDQMKWGARARIGVKGYDLTVNYVQEEKRTLIPRQRLGLTFKGDVGDFGVYGAVGHQFATGIDSINSYLLGADYSYNLNYDTKIHMQLEYLVSELGDQELIVGGIGYPIDDFSEVSMITTVSLANGSTVLIPRYQITLARGVDLAIGGSFTANKNPEGFLRLSYPF